MAQHPDRRVYVQVCLTAMDAKTSEQEFGNLRAIEDDCPKYVVTLNDIITSPEGAAIQHLNLVNFLSMPS